MWPFKRNAKGPQLEPPKNDKVIVGNRRLSATNLPDEIIESRRKLLTGAAIAGVAIPLVAATEESSPSNAELIKRIEELEAAQRSVPPELLDDCTVCSVPSYMATATATAVSFGSVITAGPYVTSGAWSSPRITSTRKRFV